MTELSWQKSRPTPRFTLSVTYWMILFSSAIVNSEQQQCSTLQWSTVSQCHTQLHCTPPPHNSPTSAAPTLQCYSCIRWPLGRRRHPQRCTATINYINLVIRIILYFKFILFLNPFCKITCKRQLSSNFLPKLG